jgi:hypothetical protein
MPLISLRQAAKFGITRVRLSRWANPFDHLDISVPHSVGGTLPVWVKLYSPMNAWCNGRDPVLVIVLSFDLDDPSWEPYAGALPDSELYRQRKAEFDTLPPYS